MYLKECKEPHHMYLRECEKPHHMNVMKNDDFNPTFVLNFRNPRSPHSVRLFLGNLIFLNITCLQSIYCILCIVINIF